jgi:uncharacterized membrane protein
MNTSKFLIGTLVGGVVLFFLGYLFYGMLLSNFFMQHSLAVAGSMKTMNELIWWALILGNLASGALITYIFLKLGSINTFGNGAGTGAAIGFLLAANVDLIRYATENSFDHTGMVVDILVGTVMFAIAGGFIGLVIRKKVNIKAAI